MNSLPTFLWKLPSLRSVYVLLCSAPECWKCTLRGPDFKIFPGGKPPDPLATHTFDTWKSCLWCKFFPSLPTPKLLRPTWDLIENPVLDLVWRNDLDPHMFFKLMYQWKWVGTILNFKIRPEKTSTNYCKFSFCNRYITDWNSIPLNIMHAPSLSSFNPIYLIICINFK